MSTIDFSLVLAMIAMKYPSDVLNLVLHIIYKFPVQSYHPTPATLRAATTALFELGYNLDHVFAHHSESYMLFLRSAIVEPLPMYALAARYSLESLAVAASTFTLEVSPSDVSDELAQQMGPIYLRRLFLQNHPNNLAKVFAPLSAQLRCINQSKPLVSVSTRFNPEEKDIQGANVVLITEDQIYFYAHREILLGRSSNNFGSLLYDPAHDAEMEVDVSRPTDAVDLIILPAIIATAHTADVLNVVLHFIYGFSVDSYRPSPATLRLATAALFGLGYNLADIFVPHSEPYMLFLQAGVAEPLAMYAVAAQHSLEPLAVAVSTFTLAVPPSDISDELAQQMGPLTQSFILAARRRSNDCYTPLLSHTLLQAQAATLGPNKKYPLVKVITPLGAQLSCPDCRQTLHDRVAALIKDWGAIKATI
ncbi:hypothetical protein FRC06_010075 [Ceratobasidium sp. 370]|nr:hypothetical protein FRC06_010075 [Ceratobasidium sp. 370]